MKRILTGFLLLVFLIPSVAYGAAAAVITNSSEGWSVRPPSEWTKETSVNGPYKMTTFYSQDRSASFRVLASDYDYGHSDKENLDAYVSLRENALKKDLLSYSKKTSKKTTLAGVKAQSLVFTWQVNGQSVRSQAVMASSEGVIYEIMLTSTEQAWEATYPLMESSLETFALLRGAKSKGTATLSVSVAGIEKRSIGARSEDVTVRLHDPVTGEQIAFAAVKKGKATLKKLSVGKTYILSTYAHGYDRALKEIRLDKKKASTKLSIQKSEEDGHDFFVSVAVSGGAYRKLPYSPGEKIQLALVTAAPQGTNNVYLVRQTDGIKLPIGTYTHTPLARPEENVTKYIPITIPAVASAGDYYFVAEYVSNGGALVLNSDLNRPVNYFQIVN